MNINHLRRIASKSPHSRYKHCSLIFAGSRLLATGYNHGEVHAEIDALNHLDQVVRNTRRPKTLHMINFMYKTISGNPGNSYPCKKCELVLNTAGFRSITYYDGYEFRQVMFI
jgi:deoxycytidylate deaminase